MTDSILFYGEPIHADAVRVPLDAEYVSRMYRHSDSRGLYQPDNLSAKGLSGGGYTYDFHGHPGPWRYPEPRIHELERKNRIHFPPKKNGVPRLKRYLHENKGQVPPNLWTDIEKAGGAERVGYPTQKPLALLDRIIKASSNPGDVVLDPFCGCATACVSAEALHRQWIGIDLSPVASRLVESRLHEQFGIFATIHHRTDVPRRTDLGRLPNYRTHKHHLFGAQEGRCAGCRMIFPFRNFEVDHTMPRSRGGSDHVDNLQLVCGACNRAKGVGTQAELIAKLKERGQLAA